MIYHIISFVYQIIIEIRFLNKNQMKKWVDDYDIQ